MGAIRSSRELEKSYLNILAFLAKLNPQMNEHHLCALLCTALPIKCEPVCTIQPTKITLNGPAIINPFTFKYIDMKQFLIEN